MLIFVLQGQPGTPEYTQLNNVLVRVCVSIGGFSAERCNTAPYRGAGWTLPRNDASEVFEVRIGLPLLVSYTVYDTAKTGGVFCSATITAVDLQPPDIECPTPSILPLFTSPGLTSVGVAYVTANGGGGLVNQF